MTVRVTAKEFSFALSRRSVPRGSTVRFVVRNVGAQPHDFVIAGRRTKVLAPKATQTIRMTFRKTGTYAFVCSVPGHAQAGMRGRFGVGRAAPAPPPSPPPVVISGSAALTEVGRFDRPVHVAAAPAEPRVLGVVEQRGTVQRVVDGVAAAEPWLDLRDRVKADSSEPGLLSLAFSPAYATDRTAYVFYNARRGNGDIRISAFTHPPGAPGRFDPASERVLLEIRKPWENHNGGLLQFGRDGTLYASVGDGDSGVLHPPGAFAQSRDDLLGGILRIDPRGAPYAIPADNPFVDVDGVRPEIWAYGLRNPWRFWLDAATGRMLIGDVGLGQREEIDLVPRGASGLNFGWPCFEGTAAFDASQTCAGAVAPIWESDRSDGGCSVIAGVVVRDPRLPALAGRFLFGDFCTGRLEALTLDVVSGRVTRRDDLGLRVPELSSFGVDAAGKVHVTSLDGRVYRLDPAP